MGDFYRANFFLRIWPRNCWHFLLIINISLRCSSLFEKIVPSSSCSMLTQFLCKCAFWKCFLQHSTWMTFKSLSFAEAICIALMGLKCTFRNKHFDQSLLMTKGNMSGWSKLWGVWGSLTRWTIRRGVIKIFEGRPSQLEVPIKVLTSLVNFLKYISKIGVLMI